MTACIISELWLLEHTQYQELDELIRCMITKIMIGYTRASILGKFEYSITMNGVLYMLYKI